jgi:rhodanese-related sulfurtransferase
MVSSLSYTDIDIPTYQQHRENRVDHLLLDVREPQEFAAGRIPGAVNSPLNEVEHCLDEIPDDKPVVVVCAHGIRSVIGARILVEAGYGGVYNLRGGTAEWSLRGLTLEW